MQKYIMIYGIVWFLLTYFALISLPTGKRLFKRLRGYFLFRWYKRRIEEMFESIRWIVINGSDEEIKQLGAMLQTAESEPLRGLGMVLSSDEGIADIRGIVNAA